jgi:ferric-dicitrate binding protein FerR (iron transport regulator)
MVSGRRSPGRTPVAMREYATAAGERLNVTLVDGTQFALAPASRIRVPVTYGQVTRDVELEGEAFFRVVHDDARPFHVRARNADALDVGTAFDVRAYLGDTTVRLAVVEGRVAVRDTMRAVAGVGLGAGDLATVSGHGQIGTARNVDLAPYVGWTRGELVFRDTPLRDVVPVLERWYGVTIVVADPELASRPIYATYDMQSMTEVLTQVTATVGAHYTRRGKMITVDPGLTLSR